MKPRSILTASEVSGPTGLYDFLSRKLEVIGIESQPEVVLHLLELSRNPNAQIREYAKVIKADQGICGRVLKLSNSALFAQRTAVTNLERACTILGIERLKAVSLGLNLSRAAAAGEELKDLSRRIWGQSVFRACLAAEAARLIAPGLVPEAFIVGLMMDAGIPLCAKLQGKNYIPVVADNPGPGRLFRREYESLTYTHVDIVTVLAKKWRFPDVLSKPLELHHIRPADTAKDDSVHRLHRIAYVVGLLDLDEKGLLTPNLLTTASSGGIVTAQRLLRVTDEEMAKLLESTASEYQVLIEAFKDIAGSLGNFEELLGRVQAGLVESIDRQIEESMAREHQGTSPPINVGGTRLEITREPDGGIVAYVYDNHGKPLVSHRLAPLGVTPEALCEHLGLETPSKDEAGRITERVRSLAA